MNLQFKFATLLIITLWLVLIFAEWLIPFNQHFIIVIPFLRKTFSLVCHQQEAKLIVQDSFHSFVCSRCAGIYSGLLLTNIFLMFYHSLEQIDTKYLFISAVPALLDIFCYSTGIYHYSKIIAFSTGLLLGSTGFLYFYSAIKQFLLEIRVTKL